MKWEYATAIIGFISAAIMLSNLLMVSNTKKKHVTKFWTPLAISMMMGIVWIITQAVAVFTPKDHLFGLGCISYLAMYMSLTLLTYFSALLTEERWLINLSVSIAVAVAIYTFLALPMGMVFEANAHLSSYGYLVIKDAHPKWVPDIVNLVLLAMVVLVGLHYRRGEKSTLLQKARNVLRFTVFLPIIFSATVELGILDATLHIEHPPITMFIVALASTMLPSVYRTIISLDKTTASLEAWEVNPLPTLVLDTGVVLHTNPAAKHTLGHEIEDIGQRLTYADETQDTITVKGKTYQVIGSEIEENLKLIMLRDITDRLTLDRLKRYCGELLLKEFEERIRNVSSYIESGGTQQKAIQSILKAISDVAKDANLITRIVSGEDVRIGKETVHLRNLIEETLALYKTLTDDRNITIALNIPESIRVVANRQLLARTLRKVLGKILDAMPQNGKMSIRARMSDDTVVIELSSTSTDDTHAKINMDVETEIIRGLMDGDIRVEFDWRRNLAVITIMLPRG